MKLLAVMLHDRISSAERPAGNCTDRPRSPWPPPRATRFHIPSAAAASPSPLYYSYDIAGAHIVMLGSYADSSRSSAQAAWLEADLAGVDRAVTPWVVVSMHAPFYSSNYAHLGEAEPMRHALERVLYRHGVDVVFAGHVHAYERSVPVYDQRLDSCAPVYM